MTAPVMPAYPAPPPLSDNARQEFVREFFAVQFALLHAKLRDPAALPVASDTDDATPLARTERLLRHWTMVPAMFQDARRHSAGPEDAEWVAGVGEVHALFERNPGAEDRPAFESGALDALFELLDAGWAAYERTDAQHQWFGCFRGTVDPGTQCLSLHVRNAVRPQSPFDDLTPRRAELHNLCAEFARAGEPPREIRCASWLNELPSFLVLFPPEYAASLRLEWPYPTGLGWWGQLISRDGRVNPRRTETFRRTGRFEYRRLVGCCPFMQFQAKIAMAPERPQSRS